MYRILDIFVLLNFVKMAISTIFANNIFANDPCGQHKKCGMATLS